MNINKPDLVNRIVQKNERYKKYIVKSVVDDVFDEIAAALQDGDKVSIYGFGTFGVKTFKSHRALHPATGEEITVPAFQNVVFKSGKELTRSVRGQSDEQTESE